MAKLIALEWDAREARVAVGSQRGSDVLVEQAFAFDLETSSGELPSPADVGTQLAAELTQRGLGGNDALVAVPRSSIELRTLTLPQAPPEEIPDMVRFQAMQAFTSIGEDWPVDYIELDSHDDTINVLAAVVSPKLVEETKQICSASELRTQCLVLRPFAAVNLLHRFESIDVYRSSLIVDLLPDGADLTAITNGKVVFMRSVRLPVSSDAKAKGVALVGELRRTIGAAQNQMGGTRIEQVIICGDETENATLHQTVSGALSLDVVAFDPFEAVRSSRQLKSDLPSSGRFAPLLGMLACQAAGTGHTLDFLNPRKRPAPPSTKRRNVVVAATLGLVVLAGSFLFLSKKKSLDLDIERLGKESTSMDKGVEKARKLIARADSINRFERGDITWLDEIREVASRMPNADDVILTEVQLATNPDNPQEGRMLLKGHVADTDVIALLEDSLRYGENRVKGFYGQMDTKLRDYPFRIETRIYVPSDVLEDGHSLGRPKLVKVGDDEKEADESTEADEAAGEDSVTTAVDASPGETGDGDATEESAGADLSDPVDEPGGEPPIDEPDSDPPDGAESAGDELATPDEDATEKSTAEKSTAEESTTEVLEATDAKPESAGDEDATEEQPASEGEEDEGSSTEEEPAEEQPSEQPPRTEGSQIS